MNFTNLVSWSLWVIIGLLGVHQIDEIQLGILKARSKLIYESRSSSWGSPKFLEAPNDKSNKKPADK